jgi:hypothetical protein
VKFKLLSVISFLFLLLTILGPRAGSAQQVQPLEPEWLRQMYAQGWEKVEEGVLRRDAGEGKYETFSYGAEGLQRVIEGYEQQLGYLEERYDEAPSDDLAELMERLQGEIDKLSENLGTAPAAEGFDGSATLECTEVAYGWDTSAGPTQSPQGVTATATAYYHTACPDLTGSTFAYALAEAVDPVTGANIVHTASNPLDNGTWLDSNATESAQGSTGCHSKAQATVTLNDYSVLEAPTAEHYGCPLPLEVTISGPATVSTDYYGMTCANVTWTASASQGSPGYTYQWYIGTTSQGTGATLTKSYCNTSKSVTVKVEATDAQGSQATQTFATNITYVGPLTASLGGPSSAATNSSTPCVNVTWTASVSGAHPGYTYKWYLGTGTTVLGTGSSYTRQYCNTSTTATAKVVVSDSDGHTATATKTTTITHTNPLPVTASISGPTEVLIYSAGECTNITWTASATGGTPGYTYTWYLGTSTTAAGTGSSLTKNFCGRQTINVKVVARDTAAQTDDATFTTVISRDYSSTCGGINQPACN